MKLAILAIALIALNPCKSNEVESVPEETPEPLAETNDKSTETTEQVQGWIGVLTPKAQAEVVAPFATTVVSFDANVGDLVEEGATLAKLDDAPIKEQVAKAQSELAAANAQAAAAASTYKYQVKGLKAGITSKASVDEAQFTLSGANARVQGAKATYDAIKLKLKKTTLVSPMAGKVAIQLVKEGQQVAEGAAVIRVISSDELFVKFAIPTEQADKVAVGSKIDIQMESRGKQISVTGKVRSVAPDLDPIAKMIFAEADLDGDQTEGMKSGTVCHIKVSQATAQTKPK